MPQQPVIGKRSLTSFIRIQLDERNLVHVILGQPIHDGQHLRSGWSVGRKEI